MPVPVWPLLAQMTLRHVALFYGGYILVFGSFVLLAGLLKVLAKRAMLSNNTEAALIWYDRLWFLFGPAVRKEIKPQIQINLAIVHAAQGNRDRALRLLSDARRAARKLKTPDLLIQTTLLISRLYAQARDWDQAVWALTEARKASEADRRAPGLLRILHLLAELQQQRGQGDEALGTWQQVRRLADQRSETGTAILALTHLGRAAYEDSDWPLAEQYFTDAISRAREAKCTDRSAVLAAVLFGRLSLQKGQYELARGYLQEAAASAKRRGDAALECSALIELGRLHVERGRTETATGYLDQAQQIATQLEDSARSAMVSQVLGDAYLQTESLQGARVHYELALNHLAKTPLLRTELLVRAGLALIQAQLEDPAAAMEALMNLETKAHKAKAHFELVVIYDALARVHALSGDGDGAVKYQTLAHEERGRLGIAAAISKQFRRLGAA